MNDRQHINCRGIIVTAWYRCGAWETVFENATGNFNDLSRVEPLRGHSSASAALEAGRRFVEDHQWQYVEDVGIYTLHVRLWWNGVWGYGVRCGDETSENWDGYRSREDAIEAGRARASEKQAELERQTARDDARRAALMAILQPSLKPDR